MEITPLGDSALIVRVRKTFADKPTEALNAVLDALHRLKDAQIPGVIELVPSYTTVAVFFDPLRVVAAGAEPAAVFEWLARTTREFLSEMRANSSPRREPSVIEIPVCYEEEFALDLDEVSRHVGLSPAEVVDLYSRAAYRVTCLGFTPGFPFLSGLPDKLATPRRAVPRKDVPAGSVAIGGAQTGIYPTRSPGGWNVIGRTPLRLFHPEKIPPVLLHTGDRVSFRSITRAEFASIEK